MQRLADALGDDAVEVGVQGGDAGGNGDVELVEVLVVRRGAVTFEERELWGPNSPQQRALVSVDAWESYLEPA